MKFILIFASVVCVLGLLSCTFENSPEPIGVSMDGKLKSLLINKNRPSREYYTFHYNLHTGRLESIDSDSTEICTINWFHNDSLHIIWRYANNSEIDVIWEVKLQNNKLLQLCAVDYFFDTVCYRAAYNPDGSIDTLNEPDSRSLVIISDISNQNYMFSEGNCQQFQFSFRRDFSPLNFKQVTFEYSGLPNSKYLPGSLPYYNHTNTISSSHSYLDPLYILGLLDIESITPNSNLIARRQMDSQDDVYTYEFDSLDRVVFYSIYSNQDESTLTYGELEYY